MVSNGNRISTRALPGVLLAGYFYPLEGTGLQYAYLGVLGVALLAVAGVLLLFVTLHLARGIGRLHGGVDGAGVGDVGDAVLYAVIGGGRGLLVEADHRGAFAREQLRRRGADAAGGTGDQRDLAGQAAAHGRRIPWGVDAAMAPARDVPSDCDVAMGPSSRR